MAANLSSACKLEVLPEAKNFQEILENSLLPTGVTYFCEYFLHILNCRSKQLEEKVMCLIGEPNRGIIPARYLLFFCFVFYLFLFLTASSGRKYQRTLGSVHSILYNLLKLEIQKLEPTGNPMSHVHHLPNGNVFWGRAQCSNGCTFMQVLKSWPVPGVQHSLRDSAMDSIVWANRVMRAPVDERPPPMLGSAAEPNKFDEEEKDGIKTMNLEDSEFDQEALKKATRGRRRRHIWGTRQPSTFGCQINVFWRTGEYAWKDIWALRSAAMQQPETRASGAHCSWSEVSHEGERNWNTMGKGRDSYWDKTTLDISWNDSRGRCSLAGDGWRPIPSQN